MIVPGNFLFENPGVIEVRELHEAFVHFKNHSLVHQIVRHSLDPRETKSSLMFWREKYRDFEAKGVDLSQQWGTLPEWEGNRN